MLSDVYRTLEPAFALRASAGKPWNPGTLEPWNLLILWQRLPLRLGRPDERDHADEVDRRHDHRGGAERKGGTQVPQQNRRGRGQVADRVVAEAHARAT